MPLGTPSYLQEYDILVARSGAMVPAGLTLGGGYLFDQGSGAFDSNSTVGIAQIKLYGSNGGAARMAMTAVANANGNSLTCYSYDGTRSVPAVSANGNAFFTFAARGYGGTSNSYPTGASFSALVDGAWSGSNQGTYWEWKGTSNGSTTTTTWLHLRNSQILQLSSTAPTANTFSGNVLFGVNNATADIAGQCGETTTSTVSAVAVAATGTVGNVTSISLTAGKWEIKGFVVISGGATGLTAASTAKMSIVTTTATNGTSGSTMTQESVYALVANGLVQMSIPAVIVNITSTTTYYMTEEVTYAAGSPTVSGTIVATRIR